MTQVELRWNIVTSEVERLELLGVEQGGRSAHTDAMQVVVLCDIMSRGACTDNNHLLALVFSCSAVLGRMYNLSLKFVLHPGKH